MAEIGPARAGDVVFVGGTGRSGTHIVAELLSRHSRYAMFPLEARFHVNPKGIGDLLEGRVGVDEFLEKLRGFWWSRRVVGRTGPAFRRTLRSGPKRRGLYLAVEPSEFDAALDRFKEMSETDLAAACRRLVLDLLWPAAVRAGKPGLVEMSSFNITGAPQLARLFPEARFIHALRDGRDAGASKVAKREKAHHPRDVAEGIRWWARRIDAIEASARELPDGVIDVVCLDELVAGEREDAYNGLLAFLGLEDERGMRAFFETEMSPAAANKDRWRSGLGPSDADRIRVVYEAELDRMDQAGYLAAGALRRALERESA